MLREFNEGGSHQQNPLGGIPLGQNNTGQPVTVEQGETAMNTPKGDFVFSDRIMIDKNTAMSLGLPKSMVGKTMADASKFINNKFKDRNDNISNSTKEKMLNTLAESQEIVKAEAYAKHADVMERNSTDMDADGPVPPGMEEFAQPMSGGGFSNFMTNYGSGIGAIGSVGAGMLGQNDKPIVNGQQNGHVVNDMTNTWETTKDAAATAYPIAGIFRGVEKIGKSAGQAVGGDKGGDFAAGFLDPMSNKFDKDTSFLEKVGGIDPIFSGMLAMRKNKERREKQSKIEAYQGNKMYSDNYAYGGQVDQYPQFGNAFKRFDQIVGPANNVVKSKNVQPIQSSKMNTNIIPSVNWTLPNQRSTQPTVQKNRSHTKVKPNPVVTAIQPKPLFTSYEQDKLASNLLFATTGQRMNNIKASPISAKMTEYLGGQRANVDLLNSINNGTYSEDSNFSDKFSQALRYSPILSNAMQLKNLKSPTMDNPILDQSKANRRYVDESGILRNADNSQNSTVKALSESGMSGSALRNSIIAAGLNRNRSLSEAYMNADNINRNVDDRADAIDRDTNLRNNAERARVKENYDRDLGAYLTRKSQLSSQVGTDIGNIGKEETYKDLAIKATGYTWDGKYYKSKDGDLLTPEQYEKVMKNIKKSTDSKAIGGFIFRGK